MRKILYDIQHITTNEYLGFVSVSHLLMHLAPRNDERQTVLSHTLTVDPHPAVTETHPDYFGNRAHFITVERDHSRLTITSNSRVAVGPAFVPDPSETPSWESVRSRCMSDHTGRSLEAHEFTYASPLVPMSSEFAEYSRESFSKDRPVLDAVMDLTRRIHTEFKFDPLATTVTTPVSEVMRHRRGVCQDFAHFQIACLRAMGIPARYVSGYLETDPPPGQQKLRGVDASHAWISFFCPGIGWIDVDPTNNCFASMRHIRIGWGRDYADICPIRGVLMGGRDQRMHVSVDVLASGALEDADPGE